MAERTIRGAITTENTKKDILDDTREMIKSIMDANTIEVSDVISIVFTATKDITKAYPAVAARELGIVNASLMCFQEMYVEGSLEKCIRCMISIETDIAQEKIKHIYLKDAAKLRPDLIK